MLIFKYIHITVFKVFKLICQKIKYIGLFRSCSIKKCKKSLIFIGPTQRTVTVDNCNDCTIVAVCRRIIIR